MRPPRKKQGYTVDTDGGAVEVSACPCFFAWLVAPDSRQTISLSCPRLRFTSAPAFGGARPARPAFGRWAGAQTALLLYHSRHRKGKTKTSRAAPRRGSCLFVAAMVPGKYPLLKNSRLTFASINGILWLYGRIVQQTMEQPPACGSVRLLGYRPTMRPSGGFLFTHIPRTGGRHFRCGGEYRPGCSDRVPAVISSGGDRRIA